MFESKQQQQQSEKPKMEKMVAAVTKNGENQEGNENQMKKFFPKYQFKGSNIVLKMFNHNLKIRYLLDWLSLLYLPPGKNLFYNLIFIL